MKQNIEFNVKENNEKRQSVKMEIKYKEKEIELEKEINNKEKIFASFKAPQNRTSISSLMVEDQEQKLNETENSYRYTKSNRDALEAAVKLAPTLKIIVNLIYLLL